MSNTLSELDSLSISAAGSEHGQDSLTDDALLASLGVIVPESGAGSPAQEVQGVSFDPFSEEPQPAAAPQPTPAVEPALSAAPAAPTKKREGMKVNNKTLALIIGGLFAAGGAGYYLYFGGAAATPKPTKTLAQIQAEQGVLPGQEMQSAPVPVDGLPAAPVGYQVAPQQYDMNGNPIPPGAATYDPVTGQMTVQPSPAQPVYDAQGNLVQGAPLQTAPVQGAVDPALQTVPAGQPLPPGVMPVAAVAPAPNASMQPGAIGAPLPVGTVAPAMHTPPAAPIAQTVYPAPAAQPQIGPQQVVNNTPQPHQVSAQQVNALPGTTVTGPSNAELEARLARLESQLAAVLAKLEAQPTYTTAKPVRVKPVVRRAAPKPVKTEVTANSEYESLPAQAPAQPAAKPAPVEYESFESTQVRPMKTAFAAPTVQAVIPGRAWLINEASGEVTSVELGSNVAGCGKVAAIDANAGEVYAGKCRMKF